VHSVTSIPVNRTAPAVLALVAAAALAAPPPARKDALPFWAHNASGDAVHLADPTPRGKWVLVEFWSSGARRAEDQKVMARLREKYLSEDRLLLFSVCVDLDFGDWLHQMDRQPDLDDGRGGKVRFYSDRRWWQMSLGVHRESERSDFIKAHSLERRPAYYLIRPGGALQSGPIPPDKLKAALTGALAEPKRK
jgi:hypothetical protein